jgi:coproporphyrinogen III oxidase-like Fe-S oxidoreductase
MLLSSMRKNHNTLTPDPWPLTPSPGLYVHVPFCQSKCPYCDFYSITSTELIPDYLEALAKEARLYQDRFSPFDSLFLGGGTPSLLASAQLATLMKILRRQFRFAPDCEITLEANPDDVSSDKLRLWQDLGVNRLSLGVQSLHERELRFLGRRHTARQTEQALDLIRAAGCANLGLDLIYGLPGQTEAAWIKTLDKALTFQPEHLSCYQLTVAPDTPLGRKVGRGRVTPLGEEAERAFFLLTSRWLTDRGYRHYEISNFARIGLPDRIGRGGPGRTAACQPSYNPSYNPTLYPPDAGEAYYCRHNLKYWRHVPYLGLGPGAHSLVGNRRWWNHRSLAVFCKALNAGDTSVEGSETLTPEQLRLETLYLGFRTREGVELAVLQARPGCEKALQELQDSGLVRVQEGRARATLEGLVVADRLPWRFMD